MIDAHHVLAGSRVRDLRERKGGGGGEFKKALVTKLAPLLEFL